MNNKTLRGISRRTLANGNAAWVVDVVRNHVRAKRSFSGHKCGGIDLALQAAQAWRDAALEQLAQIKRPRGGKKKTLTSALKLPNPYLVKMIEAAKAAGTTCLDTRWRGAEHPYRFKCAHGHTWKRIRNVLRRNPHCPICTRERITGAAQAKAKPIARTEISVADSLLAQRHKLHERARTHGGQCLSDPYLGWDQHHRFRCARGHEWSALARAVLHGAWCHSCIDDAGVPTLEHARQTAQANGGRCLSPSYEGGKPQLTWECGQAHVWKASYRNILKHGFWCVQCVRAMPVSARR